ncbi:MAG: hypothetical protein H7A35_05125 [Planctomycetales bacterium]|nr:hypothetical protein [bacterium]UNM09440.1 MAG: hypothetical protein H7A35_05125 [Planctomycetales bacterium]
MSSYIDEYIQSGQGVIISVSGQPIHGVIKGSDNGFLLVDVDNQGPRLLSIAHVEQIIPKG